MRFKKITSIHEKEIGRDQRIMMRIDANIDSSESHPLRITRITKDVHAILEKRAKLMLLTHRGRPKGREATLSTKHLAKRLELLLEHPVVFVEEISRTACDRAWEKQPEAIVLLENTRFEEGEEEDDAKLAKKWAGLGDLFVNNAFSVSHRKHASVHRITKYIEACAGTATLEEINHLNEPREEPFLLVLGGAKMETKIPLLKQLVPQTQAVLLGSGFLLEQHREELLKVQKKFGEKIIIPVDVRLEKEGEIQVIETEEFINNGNVYTDWRPIDIGPEAEMQFATHALEAKSIFWNGPLGIAEMEEGENGTISMIDALMHAKQAQVIIGGGDTLEFINPDHSLSHIFLSTGGGATLAFLSNAPMPGLEVLT